MLSYLQLSSLLGEVKDSGRGSTEEDSLRGKISKEVTSLKFSVTTSHRNAAMPLLGEVKLWLNPSQAAHRPQLHFSLPKMSR